MCEKETTKPLSLAQCAHPAISQDHIPRQPQPTKDKNLTSCLNFNFAISFLYPSLKPGTGGRKSVTSI